MLRLVLITFLTVVFASGCRQPVAGTNTNSPGLFDFSGLRQNGIFAQSGNASSSFFNRGGNRNLQIQTQTPEEYEEYSALAQQINSLNQQVGSFDSDNQQLFAEIAGLKQKLQVANDYNNQIRQQLADNTAQFQQLQSEKRTLEQQLSAAQVGAISSSNNLAPGNSPQADNLYASSSGQVPSRLIGSATVRANNSLLQKFSAIRVPGGQARMDGDVIRIEFPSDNLFTPGTYQIRPNQVNTIRNIATTIRQYFPAQIIGIEAHWDGTQLNPPSTSHHQLTATQALAVFNQLLQLGLPADQLFTMAMGSNRPRHSQPGVGGISPNRRIEIVVYPETYNGS